MKYVLEFGVRGGAYVDNLVIPTRDLAEKMARSLVATFQSDYLANGAGERDWLFSKGVVRMTWKSSTHFVAVSKLDGTSRGPAAPGLWRKPVGGELLSHSVCEWSYAQLPTASLSRC